MHGAALAAAIASGSRCRCPYHRRPDSEAAAPINDGVHRREGRSWSPPLLATGGCETANVQLEKKSHAPMVVVSADTTKPRPPAAPAMSYDSKL